MKSHLAWVFSCKFAAYLQNNFSSKQLWLAASGKFTDLPLLFAKCFFPETITKGKKKNECCVTYFGQYLRERQLLRNCFDGTCIWRISNSKNVRYQYHLYPKLTSLQGFQIFWRKQLFWRALYKSCSKNIIESCYRASVNEITAIIHKLFWD